MKPSLHDNWIYAQHVDYDSREIVLHTVYVHCEPYEYTDVIFENVLVHHFETQCMTTNKPYPSNVLFDIEEEEASLTLERYKDPIISKLRYGWPADGWKNLKDLADILTKDGHRSFHIHGSVGLDGFVFAKKMVRRSRSSRWTNSA